MTSCSRLVEVQQIKRNWLKHQDRLIHVKSTLNTRHPLPRAPSTRRQNLLKSLEVELENKALLKKLTDRHHNKADLSICQNPQIPKSTHKNLKLRLIQTSAAYKADDRHNLPPFAANLDIKIPKHNIKIWLQKSETNSYPSEGIYLVIQFQLVNNQMKYQTGRKNLMSEQSMVQHQSILEVDKDKLFAYLSKYRRINIDGQIVMVRIRKDSLSVSIEISIGDKENHQAELQVSISLELFKEKYRSNVEELIRRLKYDRHSQNFYII